MESTSPSTLPSRRITDKVDFVNRIETLESDLRTILKKLDTQSENQAITARTIERLSVIQEQQTKTLDKIGEMLNGYLATEVRVASLEVKSNSCANEYNELIERLTTIEQQIIEDKSSERSSKRILRILWTALVTLGGITAFFLEYFKTAILNFK